MEGGFTLQPTSKTKWVAIFFVILAPLIFSIGLYYNWPMRLRIGATLFPVLGAIAYGLIHFFAQHFGLYASFNPRRDEVVIRFRKLLGENKSQQISISSIASISLAFTQTVSTQFTEKRKNGPGFIDKSDSWDSYKLALIIQNGPNITLIESGAKRKLEQIGSTIAKALHKPFEMIDKDK
jgi:hypothetical protein